MTLFMSNQWDSLRWGDDAIVYPVNEPLDAQYVDFVPRRSFDGEYSQDERECYVIFKVGDKTYKKTGYQSSYDDAIVWSGPVVEAKPKTVTVWE